MATSKAMKGLGDLSGSIGKSMDEIENQPVTVTDILVSSRPLFNPDTRETEEREIVVVTLDNGAKYYAWSPSLAEKLGAVQAEDLPAVGVFRKAKTRAGFEVWTVDNA